MTDCIICWAAALATTLSPKGLGFWVRAIYICTGDRTSKATIFSISLNQYSIRQVTTILKNLENVPVTKIMISWKKYHCGCPSVVFLEKMQPALPNQWALWPPLALKGPLHCVASYSEFRPSPAPTASGTCVAAFPWSAWTQHSPCSRWPATEGVGQQKVEYMPCSKRAQTLRLF